MTTILTAISLALVSVFAGSGCASDRTPEKENSHKIRVVENTNLAEGLLPMN